MINTFKNVLAVLLLSTLTTTAYAGVGGAAGYGSDYIFRGVSQTDGGNSAGASANWDHDSGIYAGVWLGQVDYADDSDLERDLFVGWSGDVAGMNLDVAYIDYNYNGDADLNGNEILIGTEFMGVSFDYYMGQDDYTDYMEFGYSRWGMDISYGMWDSIGDNWSVSRSFDLPMGVEGSIGYVSFMADDGSLLEDEDSFIFGVSKQF
jgi:uncharacterized protein (TIGR02001 family)